MIPHLQQTTAQASTSAFDLLPQLDRSGFTMDVAAAAPCKIWPCKVVRRPMYALVKTMVNILFTGVPEVHASWSAEDPLHHLCVH